MPFTTHPRLELLLFVSFIGIFFLAHFFYERLRRLQIVKIYPAWLVRDLTPQVSKFHWHWLVALLLVEVAALAWLEFDLPYYFNSGDNYAEFSPVLLEAGRRFFHGHWLGWSPYQFLGGPVASLGIYALTYPFTYVAYAIAAFGLGNEGASLEVFAVIHLLAGTIALYLALRALAVRPSLSAAAVFSFQFSGFTLIAGRSWYYMLPVNLWAPVLIYGVIRLQCRWEKQLKATRLWVLGMAFASALLFHAGNAQMWLYTMGFVTAVIIFLRIQYRVRDERALVGTVALALALILPLAIPQALATSAARRIVWGDGITGGLISLLVPGKLFEANLPNHWEYGDSNFAGQFYYSGTLFTLVALVTLATLGFFYFRPALVAKNPWAVLGGIAFLLALGDPGILWTWQTKLPVLNKFSNPFKLLTFVNLFFALAGATVIERAIRRSPRAHYVEIILLAPFFVAMAYHVHACRMSFYEFASRQYPELPKELQSLLHEGRVAALSPHLSVSPTFALSLPHNLATFYRVIGVNGSDHFNGTPLFEQSLGQMTAPEILREWGIRWVLVHETSREPVFSGNPLAREYEMFSAAKHERLARWTLGRPADREIGPVKLWQIVGAKPLAYLESLPANELPTRFSNLGLQIEIPTNKRPDSDFLIAAFLSRPGLRAQLAGKALDVAEDPFHRIKIVLPPGAVGTVEIFWNDGWRIGLTAGGAAACLGLALLRPSGHTGNREEPRQKNVG